MKELRLDATIENYETVNAFVEEQLEAQECPMKVQIQLLVALEEMYVNVAHYAYGEETGMATIQTDIVPGRAEIWIIDSGMAFDPLAKPDPDIHLSAEDRPIGGLGVYMVKKSMDAFTYERKNEQNIVYFAKNW